MEKAQRGNVVVSIIMIVVAMAIAGGVIYLSAKKVAVPEQKSAVVDVATQPTTPAPVAQAPEQPVATQLTPVAPADEAASWQTYRNDQYGYEIKYPTDWVIKEKDYATDKEAEISGMQTVTSYPYTDEQLPLGNLDTTDGPSAGKDAPSGFAFNIAIWNNSKNIPVKDFLLYEPGLAHNSAEDTFKVKTVDVKIGENIFTREEFLDAKKNQEQKAEKFSTSAGELFIANNNGKIFDIDGAFHTKGGDKEIYVSSMNKTEYAKYQDIFDKMLTTLKFTK